MSQLVSYTGPTSSTDNQLRTQTSSRSPAYDPVDKLRVSTPQALIDTDFEYGTQPTKWETLSLQQNRPSVYYAGQQVLTITAITGSGTLNGGFTLTGTFTLATGAVIFIQNSLNTDCNGWRYVSTGGTNTATIQGTVGTTVPATNFFNPSSTYVYPGFFYSGCGITLAVSAFTFVGTTITVTTSTPHGLSAGSFIYVLGLGGGTPAPNGAYAVATVPTQTTFTYIAATAPTVAITNAAGQTNLFSRPSGYVEPRTFDGGVSFTAAATVPDQQLIRQTRRYFRYQSGKGVQFSTGSSLRPTLFNPILTASSLAIGAAITVTTPSAHNLTTNCTVQVTGVDQTGYNGTYRIVTVPSATSFTYTATIAPSSFTTTGNEIRVVPVTWFGSSNRVGFFDLQNGFFFEYDGQTLYAVVRNSVNQLNGRAQVTQNSATVTGVAGSGCQWGLALKPMDYIVIRGQSYKVISIASDTSMTISPEYKGTSINTGVQGVVISKTIDERVPQSRWYDVCDGSSGASNPSGYNLDLSRMQMWYIDYSWYGAGSIRFGFRGKDGAVTYVHQVQNNNVKFEAYMRSGNMAAHYESNNQNIGSYLTDNLLFTDTVIKVADPTAFASSGVVIVRGNASTVPTANAVEYIAYSGKSGNNLTGLTRAIVGGNSSPQTFSYSASAPTSVYYASPDTAPNLYHWGSSVIMDGQFNDDKSLLFNFGMTTAISTSTAGQTTAVMAIRLAPSADNGQTGLLGSREVINRAQLQLDSLGLFTTGGGYFIQLFLNGFASAAFTGSFQAISTNTSSLAQIALNTTLGTTIINGESIAAKYSNVSGPTTLELGNVRDLGNSILGGGTTNTVPTTQANYYPDGPDIVYIVATALTSTASTLVARLSWKEAQA